MLQELLNAGSPVGLRRLRRRDAERMQDLAAHIDKRAMLFGKRFGSSFHLDYIRMELESSTEGRAGFPLQWSTASSGQLSPIAVRAAASAPAQNNSVCAAARLP